MKFESSKALNAQPNERMPAWRGKRETSSEPTRGRRQVELAHLSAKPFQCVQVKFPAIKQQRISGGIGRKDVLPGLDDDLFVGGIFNITQKFGPLTVSRLESHWVTSNCLGNMVTDIVAIFR